MTNAQIMVRSLYPSDCGVCAVANALGASWGDAATAIFGDGFWNKLRFNTKTKQIIAALGDLELVRVKYWQEIPDRSVVKVIPPECEGTGNWHWVVWRDGKVWDSNSARPRSWRSYDCRLVSYLGAKT
jgi:hypothetical protein